MGEFLQYTVNGLIAGSSYGLLALAMTLIFGILHVPNFALGAIFALGAFIAFYVTQWLGSSYYLLSFVPVLVMAVVIGLGSERIVFRPLSKGPHAAGFIGALGLYSIFEGGWNVWFGPHWRNVSSPFGDFILQIGPISLTLQRLFLFVICMAFAIAIYYLIYRTMTGKMIRASSENKDVSLLMGVSTDRMTSLTFIIGHALAGIAGVVIAPTAMVGASMGLTPILKAFIVVTLGGMGSATGAIVGGLIMGLGENYGAAYISSMYKEVFSFGIFLFVLLLMPQGLYRR